MDNEEPRFRYQVMNDAWIDAMAKKGLLQEVPDMAKSAYNKQFKKGNYPDQHWDESTRVNTHEADPPSAVRKRNGVALGSQVEANPGMVAKNDYKRKGKK